MTRTLRIALLTTLLAPLTGCEVFNTMVGLDNCDDRTLYEALAADRLRRDDRCEDSFEEFLVSGALTQADNAMGIGLVETGRWSSWVSRIKNDAGISPLAQIRVATDFRTTGTQISRVGGGVAGHNLVILDGKFLDILMDLAAYRGLVDTGLLPEDYIAAADAIVRRHMSALGPVQPVFDPRRFPANARDGAQAHFAGLAGAIVYHEFGHYFLAHMQERFAQSYAIFALPEDSEDESDDVAGALSRKAGNSLDDVVEMYDLMAFYSLNKLPQFGFTSLAQVKGDTRIQFGMSDPRYSSLAARKDIALSAYRSFEDLADDGIQMAKVADNSVEYPELPEAEEYAEVEPTEVPEHLRWNAAEEEGEGEGAEG